MYNADLRRGHLPRRPTIGSRPNGSTRTTRLRASIVIPVQNPSWRWPRSSAGAGPPLRPGPAARRACALGHRQLWPIYKAAESTACRSRIHAGSATRHAPSGQWLAVLSSSRTHVQLRPTFQSQLLSLIARRRLHQVPSLKRGAAGGRLRLAPRVSCGAAMKMWRAMRKEMPWVDRLAGADRPRARPLHPAARRRPAGAGAAWTRSWSKSGATTCCSSRPTSRTGGSTATIRCPPGISPEPGRASAMRDNALATYPLAAKRRPCNEPDRPCTRRRPQPKRRASASSIATSIPPVRT